MLILNSSHVTINSLFPDWFNALSCYVLLCTVVFSFRKRTVHVMNAKVSHVGKYLSILVIPSCCGGEQLIMPSRATAAYN